MNKNIRKRSAHSQVVALFQSNAPCGECLTCLGKAVNAVCHAENATPDACRHLWAVVSACVEAKGWEATRDEFIALARPHFQGAAEPYVKEMVCGLMSMLSTAAAA